MEFHQMNWEILYSNILTYNIGLMRKEKKIFLFNESCFFSFINKSIFTGYRSRKKKFRGYVAHKLVRLKASK